jgi:hypothetical protein
LERNPCQYIIITDPATATTTALNSSIDKACTQPYSTDDTLILKEVKDISNVCLRHCAARDEVAITQYSGLRDTLLLKGQGNLSPGAVPVRTEKDAGAHYSNIGYVLVNAFLAAPTSCSTIGHHTKVACEIANGYKNRYISGTN